MHVKYIQDNVNYRTSLQDVEGASILHVGDNRLVKWKDGRYYKATILDLHQSKPSQKSAYNFSTISSLHRSMANTNPKTTRTRSSVRSKPTVTSHTESTKQVTNALPPVSCFPDNAEMNEISENPKEKSIASSDLSEYQPSYNSTLSSSSSDRSKNEITLHINSENQTKTTAHTVFPKNENSSQNTVESSAGFTSEYEPSISTSTSQSDVIDTPVFKTNSSSVGTVACTLDQYSNTNTSPIVVNKCSNTKTRRIWDKRQSCIFCKKLVTKLPRHFLQVHPDEREVIEFSNLPPSNPIRIEILNKLRSAGNFIHNSVVLKEKKGTLIPKRRKADVTSPSKVLPCPNCNQFFMKKTLYKHKRNCKGLNSPLITKKYRSSAIRIAKYMLPVNCGSERYLKLFKENVLSGMKESRVFKMIENDPLIIKFGMEQFEQFEHQPSHKNTIRNRLRELGRMMTEATKINSNIKTLTDLLNVQNFETLLCAVKRVALFNPETNTFKIPSLAIKLGNTVQKCAAIIRKEAILERNSDGKINIDDFQSLYNSEWPIKISAKAHVTLHEAQFNRGIQLPHPTDMVKLNKFIVTEREKAIAAFKTKVNPSTYAKLAKVALASIIIFNRKRAGDAHNITIDNYLKAGAEELYPDTYNNLSKEEQELVKSFSRIETRGKKGRKVPVLLTPNMKVVTELLVRERSMAGILQENRYLFAIPGTTKSCYRGSDVIRQLRRKACVSHEERITTTSLRKEAATLSAVCGLPDTQVDQLANFLGHDIKVHREYYRLPESTLQKATVGRFLRNIERNEEGSILCGNRGTTGTINSNETIGMVNTENHEKDTNSESHLITEQTIIKRKLLKRKHMWTVEETEILSNEMSHHLVLGTLPGKKECESLINKHRMLKVRSWLDIKYKIKNIISSKRLVEK